jgi:proline iminopeptidase
MDLPGRLVEVRGTHLHVVEHGDPDAPALLFVHGGPGQGSHDFLHHQADLLARRLHLVAVDQRGALFSDPLGPAEQTSETDVVADLEALREALGLESWAVLGHSFGGRMALRYAVQHPARVRRVLFENPAWDHRRSRLTQVEAARAALEEAGADTAAADVLLEQEVPVTLAQRAELFERVGELLGTRDVLWFHQREHQLGDPLPSEHLPADVRERGDAPAAQLLAHPELDESLPRLFPDLAVPALLLLGLYDTVTDDDSVELFNADVDDGEVVWFEESGHFCHVEEPEAYARVVGDFVTRA